MADLWTDIRAKYGLPPIAAEQVGKEREAAAPAAEAARGQEPVVVAAPAQQAAPQQAPAAPQQAPQEPVPVVPGQGDLWARVQQQYGDTMAGAQQRWSLGLPDPQDIDQRTVDTWSTRIPEFRNDNNRKAKLRDITARPSEKWTDDDYRVLFDTYRRGVFAGAGKAGEPSAPEAVQADTSIQSFDQFKVALQTSNDPTATFGQLMEREWKQKTPEQSARLFNDWVMESANLDSQTYDKKRRREILDMRESDVQRVFPQYRFNRPKYEKVVQLYGLARELVDMQDSPAALQEKLELIPPADRPLLSRIIPDVASKRMDKSEGVKKLGTRFQRGVKGMVPKTERFVAGLVNKLMWGSWHEAGDKTMQGMEWAGDMRTAMAESGDPAKGENWATEAMLGGAEMAPPMIASTMMKGGKLKQMLFWTSQIAPDIEKDLVSRGLDRGHASNVALLAGALESWIEMINPNQLALMKQNGMRGLREYITDAAREGVLKEYATEEGLQGLTEVAARYAAHKIDPNVPFDLAGEMNDWYTQMQQTAGPMAAMLALPALSGAKGLGKKASASRQDLLDKLPAELREALQSEDKYEAAAALAYLPPEMRNALTRGSVKELEAAAKAYERGIQSQMQAMGQPVDTAPVMPPDVAAKLEAMINGAPLPPAAPQTPPAAPGPQTAGEATAQPQGGLADTVQDPTTGGESPVPQPAPGKPKKRPKPKSIADVVEAVATTPEQQAGERDFSPSPKGAEFTDTMSAPGAQVVGGQGLSETADSGLPDQIAAMRDRLVRKFRGDEDAADDVILGALKDVNSGKWDTSKGTVEQQVMQRAKTAGIDAARAAKRRKTVSMPEGFEPSVEPDVPVEPIPKSSLQRESDDELRARWKQLGIRGEPPKDHQGLVDKVWDKLPIEMKAEEPKRQLGGKRKSIAEEAEERGEYEPTQAEIDAKIAGRTVKQVEDEWKATFPNAPVSAMQGRNAMARQLVVHEHKTGKAAPAQAEVPVAIPTADSFDLPEIPDNAIAAAKKAGISLDAIGNVDGRWATFLGEGATGELRYHDVVTGEKFTKQRKTLGGQPNESDVPLSVLKDQERTKPPVSTAPAQAEVPVAPKSSADLSFDATKARDWLRNSIERRPDFEADDKAVAAWIEKGFDKKYYDAYLKESGVTLEQAVGQLKFKPKSIGGKEAKPLPQLPPRVQQVDKALSAAAEATKDAKANKKTKNGWEIVKYSRGEGYKTRWLLRDPNTGRVASIHASIKNAEKSAAKMKPAERSKAVAEQRAGYVADQLVEGVADVPEVELTEEQKAMFLEEQADDTPRTGEPVTLTGYHASTGAAPTVSPATRRTKMKDLTALGAFFYGDKFDAERLWLGEGAQRRVFERSVEFASPFVFKRFDELYGYTGVRHDDPDKAAKVTQALKDRGHDGYVKLYQSKPGVDEFVVFNQDAIKEADDELAGMRTQAEDTVIESDKAMMDSARAADLDEVKAAIAKSAGKSGRATIADVRDALPNMTRDEVDDLLREMNRSGAIRLYHGDDPRKLTQRDKDAEWKTASGETRHYVYLNEPVGAEGQEASRGAETAQPDTATIRPEPAKADFVRQTPKKGTPERDALEAEYQAADDAYNEAYDAVSTLKSQHEGSKYGTKRREQLAAKLEKARDKLSAARDALDPVKERRFVAVAEDSLEEAKDEASRILAIDHLNDVYRDNKVKDENGKVLRLDNVESPYRTVLQMGEDIARQFGADAETAKQIALDAWPIISTSYWGKTTLKEAVARRLEIHKEEQAFRDAQDELRTLKHLDDRARSPIERELDTWRRNSDKVAEVMERARAKDKAMKAEKEAAEVAAIAKGGATADSLTDLVTKGASVDDGWSDTATSPQARYLSDGRTIIDSSAMGKGDAATVRKRLNKIRKANETLIAPDKSKELWDDVTNRRGEPATFLGVHKVVGDDMDRVFFEADGKLYAYDADRVAYLARVMAPDEWRINTSRAGNASRGLIGMKKGEPVFFLMPLSEEMADVPIDIEKAKARGLKLGATQQTTPKKIGTKAAQQKERPLTKAQEHSIDRILDARDRMARGKVDKKRFESDMQTIRTHAAKLGLDVPSVGTYFHADAYRSAADAVEMEIGKKYGSHPTAKRRAARDAAVAAMQPASTAEFLNAWHNANQMGMDEVTAAAKTLDKLTAAQLKALAAELGQNALAKESGAKIRADLRDQLQNRVGDRRRMEGTSLNRAAESAAERAQREADESRPIGESYGSIGGGGAIVLDVDPIRDEDIPGAVTVPDPEVERRRKQAHGLKKEGWWERAKGLLLSAGHAMTRAQEQLPDTGEFGSDNEFFRLLKQAGPTALDEAMRRVAAIVKPMTANELELFEWCAVVENQLAALQMAQPLRFGMPNREAVEAERDRLRALVARVPAVATALEKRKDIVRETVEALVEKKLLPEKALDSVDTYYHQQVHFYAMRNIAASPKAHVGSRKRGFQKSRITGRTSLGEQYDYNTAYIEAETAWLTDALVVLREKELFDQLMERRDSKQEYKQQAKDDNFETLVGGPEVVSRINELRGLIAESNASEDKNDSAERMQRKVWIEELQDIDPTYTYRTQIAKMSAILRRDLGMEPDEDYDLDDEDGTGGPGWWQIVNEQAREGNPAALGLFKAISERNQFIREELGDRYKTWKDVAEENGDVVWTAPEGNLFYRAYTVPERLIEQLMRGAVEEIGVRKEDIREALAMGGPKAQYAISPELAAQLDATEKPKMQGMWANLADALMGSWKQWTLINPKRFAGYNLRNMLGDIEVTVAGLPGAIKIASSRLDELKRYHLGGFLSLSPELRAARDNGAIGSGFAATDVPGLKDTVVFRRFFAQLDGKRTLVQKATDAPNAYFAAAKKYTEFREDLLRYATYLHYLDQIRNGTLKHYGGSKKSVVDRLIVEMGPEVAAAHLSRNLIGDYGNTTVLGNWLARRLMPFWRFQEINIFRYPRMAVNAWQAGSHYRAAGTLGVGAAKVLLTSRLAWMYGAVWAWNNFIAPLILPGADDDDDENQPPYDRANLNIMLGKNEDGSIRRFRNISTLGDFLEWFGLNEAFVLYEKLRDKQMTGGDVAAEMSTAWLEKSFGSLRPELGVAAQGLFGVSGFPEPTAPRSVRKDEAIPNALGLLDEYKWMKGMFLEDGTRPRSYYFQRWMLGVSDPRQDALSAIYEARSDFMKKIGKQEIGIYPISRYKEARDAYTNGDQEAFLEWKDKFTREFGSKARERFVDFARSIDPIANKMSDAEEMQFATEFLTSEQREKLRVAREYSASMRDTLLTWWDETEQPAEKGKFKTLMTAKDEVVGGIAFRASTPPSAKALDNFAAESGISKADAKQALDKMAADELLGMGYTPQEAVAALRKYWVSVYGPVYEEKSGLPKESYTRHVARLQRLLKEANGGQRNSP